MTSPDHDNQLTSDQVVSQMLDRRWTEADLREAAQLLERIEASDQLREQVREVDELRAALCTTNESDSSEGTGEVVEPTGGWGAFEARLLDRLNGESIRQAPMRLTQPYWGRVAMIGALAAMVMLGIGIALLFNVLSTSPVMPGFPSRSAKSPGSSATISPAAMSPADRAEQVQLFRELSQVFDGRTGWVATSDHVSDMGLSDEPATDASAGNALLILRIGVSRHGSLLSRSDMVVVAGQTARLEVPFESGQRLRYLVSTTAGRQPKVTFWIELLGVDARQTVAAFSTTLTTTPGATVRTAELTSSSGALRFDVGFYEAPQQQATNSAGHS